jgi:hypothetical protein
VLDRSSIDLDHRALIQISHCHCSSARQNRAGIRSFSEGFGKHPRTPTGFPAEDNSFAQWTAFL